MITPFVQRAALTLAVAASISSTSSNLPFAAGGDGFERHASALASPVSTLWMSRASSSSQPASATAAVLPLPFRQYRTANDIPSSLFKAQKTIRGRVVKVIDGDTVRIRHTPLYPLSNGERGCVGRTLSECTISVRLYGVDAPETAKRGNPGQPYSREAAEYLSKRVYDKVVTVKLLRKDQYARVVGKVTTWNRYLPFLRSDASTGLAERGYASLYTGGGAEYDGNRDRLEKKIQRAQRKRLGIWSNGIDGYVDPAAYKRNIKARRNGAER